MAGSHPPVRGCASPREGTVLSEIKAQPARREAMKQS